MTRRKSQRSPVPGTRPGRRQGTDAPSPNGQAQAWSTRGDALGVSQARSWLWTDHVAFGCLTELSGPKGVGKSSLLCALAADVSGGPRLDRQRPRVPRAVVWFAGEEDVVSETRPKLLAAGARMEQLIFPGRDHLGHVTRRVQLPGDLSELAEHARTEHVGLIVLDPWSSCLAAGSSSSDAVLCRGIMEGLAALASSQQMAVVISRNFRKDRSGPADTHGLGSSEVTNVARTCLQLRPHPDRPRWYVAVVTATNLCLPPAPRAYRLVMEGTGPGIEWGESLSMTADELAEQEVSAAGRDERRDAARLLIDQLTERSVPAMELLLESKKAGISESTMRRVKAELHIPSRRVRNDSLVHWEWGPIPEIEEENRLR